MKAEFKRKLIATLIVPALGLSVAGSSLAADRSDSDKGSAATRSETQGGSAAREGSATQSSARDIRASKLMGMTVKNAQGENLGKIDDLVVDVANQRVHYAVLASGGVMGLGGKLFAYPVSLFRTGADKDELTLNVDKERLKKAPGFESKNWPQWGEKNDNYRSEVDRYFGPTVSVKPMASERLARASTLIGKDVDDRNGKDAGKIKDLVVNLGNGRVHYAVMDFDKAWSTDDKYLPMALQAFTYPTDKDKDLVLNMDKNQLDMAQGVEKNRWDDLDINDPAYKRRVDSYMRTASSLPPATKGAAGRSADRDARDAARDTRDARDADSAR